MGWSKNPKPLKGLPHVIQSNDIKTAQLIEAVEIIGIC